MHLSQCRGCVAFVGKLVGTPQEEESAAGTLASRSADTSPRDPWGAKRSKILLGAMGMQPLQPHAPVRYTSC